MVGASSSERVVIIHTEQIEPWSKLRSIETYYILISAGERPILCSFSMVFLHLFAACPLCSTRK